MDGITAKMIMLDGTESVRWFKYLFTPSGTRKRSWRMGRISY